MEPNLTPQTNLKQFSKLVAEAHNATGWSLREVATLTRLDHSYIWQILNAQRRPSRDVLLRLCLYGWSLDLEEVDQILEACGHKPFARTHNHANTSQRQVSTTVISS